MLPMPATRVWSSRARRRGRGTDRRASPRRPRRARSPRPARRGRGAPAAGRGAAAKPAAAAGSARRTGPPPASPPTARPRPRSAVGASGRRADRRASRRSYRDDCGGRDRRNAAAGSCRAPRRAREACRRASLFRPHARAGWARSPQSPYRREPPRSASPLAGSCRPRPCANNDRRVPAARLATMARRREGSTPSGARRCWRSPPAVSRSGSALARHRAGAERRSGSRRPTPPAGPWPELAGGRDIALGVLTVTARDDAAALRLAALAGGGARRRRRGLLRDRRRDPRTRVAGVGGSLSGGAAAARRRLGLATPRR